MVRLRLRAARRRKFINRIKAIFVEAHVEGLHEHASMSKVRAGISKIRPRRLRFSTSMSKLFDAPMSPSRRQADLPPKRLGPRPADRRSRLSTLR